MIKTRRKSTSQELRDALRSKIETGFFRRGEALPPERLIAQEYGVSYMTVRKAVGELVDSNYLERQPGCGTFVRNDLDQNKVARIVGLLVPVGDYSEIGLLTSRLCQLAQEDGWLHKLFLGSHWDDRVVYEAISTCDAVVSFHLESLDRIPARVKQKLKERGIPFVLAGTQGGHVGLDSVCCPDPQAVVMALDHLIQAGHSEIAMVFQNASDPTDPANLNLAYWKQRLGLTRDPERLRKLLIEVNVPFTHSPLQPLYDEVRSRIGRGRPPFTAMVIPLSFAWGALAAIEDCGLNIPEELSLVVIGDRQEAVFYRPRLSMVRTSYARHGEEAWRLIRERMDGLLPAQSQHRLVIPELIAGETVKSLA